ncbi:helix-turn-helix domain-containing protein [Brevundimonas sp. Marseille-Q4549]|jgi:predicted transcriptional regulator
MLALNGPCIYALTYCAFLHILPVMQNVAPEVIEVEQRAKDAGLTMASILSEVGVAQSTWWRWRKGGVEPRLGTLRDVAHALDRRIALTAANDDTATEKAA